MAEPTSIYSDEQLSGDGVSKKDLVVFLQENASIKFQQEHKVKGQLKSIAKSRSKDELVAAYKALFESKAFKAEGEDEEAAAKAQADKDAAAAADLVKKTEKMAVKDSKEKEPPKYNKRVMRKGDERNWVTKGDKVSVFYTGKLEDGTVFDSNTAPPRRGKKPQPLKFKVGAGAVIKGWDEALQTMSSTEKAEITVEPEWAYGKKGNDGGKVPIPPNARLIFEVELVGIE